MPKPTPRNNLIFDLDGTLVDSVYQHVLAWREALDALGIHLSNWKIHRRIGMSDELLLHSFMRDAGRKFSKAETQQLKKSQTESYFRRSSEIQPLPGAKELLHALEEAEVPHAIGTSSNRERAQPSLKMLGITSNATVITGDEIKNAKPNPDLFLACAKKLRVNIEDCVVIGDSTWDLLAAQRARALGVGLLCGGFGEEELNRAGAYRVYADPADLLVHLDELGVRIDVARSSKTSAGIDEKAGRAA